MVSAGAYGSIGVDVTFICFIGKYFLETVDVLNLEFMVKMSLELVRFHEVYWISTITKFKYVETLL